MVIEDVELLYNDATGRYTLYQPSTGKSQQTSGTAGYNFRWMGIPEKRFNSRQEVEDYMKSCKVSLLTGSTKELGVPK